MTEMTEKIRALHARADAEIGAWLTRFSATGGKTYCAKGCANCCRLAVETTLPEALYIAGRLSEEQGSALDSFVGRLKKQLHGVTDLRSYLRSYRETMVGCPFLESGGGCGIYESRPLACRALISTRNADWCGVDLSRLHPLEKQAFLSSLDASVVSFPTHYAAVPREIGCELEEAAAAEGIRRWGVTLSGNFPLLAWLVRERSLEVLLSRGSVAITEMLGKEGPLVSLLIRLG